MNYKRDINIQSVEYPDKTNYYFALQEICLGKKSAVLKRGYLFLGFDEHYKLGDFFAKGKHN